MLAIFGLGFLAQILSEVSDGLKDHQVLYNDIKETCKDGSVKAPSLEEVQGFFAHKRHMEKLRS